MRYSFPFAPLFLLAASQAAFPQACTTASPTVLSTLTSTGGCGATTWHASYTYSPAGGGTATQSVTDYSPAGVCYGNHYDCDDHFMRSVVVQGCIGMINSNSNGCSGPGNVIPVGSPITSYELVWDALAVVNWQPYLL